MKDTNLDELIDAYLKKNLTDEQKLHLDQKMESDPEIRKMVKESDIAFEYIRYKKYEEIRRKMSDYDRINSPQISRKKNGAGYKKEFVILLLILLTGIFYLSHHFSPEKVARRNLIPAAQYTSESVSATKAVMDATNFFIAENYATAGMMFIQASLSAENDHYHIVAWNALMCELAQEGFNESIHKKLMLFSNIKTLNLDQRSARIRSLFSSRIIRWFIYPAGNNIPPIRPRLM